MKTRDCTYHREALLRVQADPRTTVPDEVALHLDECKACHKLFDAAKLDFDADVFEVIPPDVRRHLIARLAAARRPRARWWVAAGIAAAMLLAGGASLMVVNEPTVTRGQLLTALVDDHIRYRHHPDRQAATDPEGLIVYLEEYVDFPVRIPFPSEATFEGARRCTLLGRRAALAFYDTSTGPVSYFIVADDGSGLESAPCVGSPRLSCLSRAGYHVVHWHQAGLLHALVGEEPTSLMSLAHACGEHSSMEEPS